MKTAFLDSNVLVYLADKDLLGKPTPTVSYPLDGAARAGREPYQTGLSRVKSQVK